jgi:hypothetical protein
MYFNKYIKYKQKYLELKNKLFQYGNGFHVQILTNRDIPEIQINSTLSYTKLIILLNDINIKFILNRVVSKDQTIIILEFDKSEASKLKEYAKIIEQKLNDYEKIQAKLSFPGTRPSFVKLDIPMTTKHMPYSLPVTRPEQFKLDKPNAAELMQHSLPVTRLEQLKLDKLGTAELILPVPSIIGSEQPILEQAPIPPKLEQSLSGFNDNVDITQYYPNIKKIKNDIISCMRKRKLKYYIEYQGKGNRFFINICDGICSKDLSNQILHLSFFYDKTISTMVDTTAKHFKILDPKYDHHRTEFPIRYIKENEEGHKIIVEHYDTLKGIYKDIIDCIIEVLERNTIEL